MKKMLSLLLVVCMVLLLAPMNADAASFKGNLKCESTKKDENDSTRSYTDCSFVINLTGGETGTETAKFTVKYNNPTEKSDFQIMHETNGMLTSEPAKATEGGTFEFDFNPGLTGEFTAFKIRFYADSKFTGKDCGGVISMEYLGNTENVTTSTNTETGNPDTGVSAPVIILGIGVVACLAVYASTSKKTKMHRI